MRSPALLSAARGPRLQMVMLVNLLFEMGSLSLPTLGFDIEVCVSFDD